jgi:hypothetical protein
VYFELLKRFKRIAHKYPFDVEDLLCNSLNEEYPIDWGKAQDQAIFEEIKAL